MSDTQAATYYKTSCRSIRRLREAGVDITDPLQVAVRFATAKQVNIPALEALTEILESLETETSPS
jgi:hypothetical protein